MLVEGTTTVSPGETTTVHGPLTVRVVPSTAHVMEGVSNEMSVMVDLVTGPAPESKGPKRAPFNLCCVLDRSGSMSGEPIERAKNAVVSICKNLGPEDRLHFVVYDHVAETIFENGTAKDADTLSKTIQSVTTRGSTNIHAALSMGRDLVKRFKSASANNCIFLFSDGQANVGPKSTEELCALARTINSEHGITVSSFGLGSSYNEEAMSSIAEASAGDYFFIATAADIPKVVEKGMRGLLNLLSSDCVLRLRGENGGIVTKILMGEAKWLVDGVPIGALRYSNSKKISFKLTVPCSASAPTNYLFWRLEYTDVVAKQPVALEGHLSLIPTTDPSLITQLSDEVAVNVAIQEAAEIDKEVISSLDKGEYEEAKSKKKRAIQVLESVKSRDKDGDQGWVAQALTQSASAMAKLESSAAAPATRKEVHYQMSRARKNSTYAMYD